MSKKSVLFVCTGNICRSPTAEAVFRHFVREEGLEDGILIDSAGTHGYHIGDPPDSRAIAMALERGILMDDLRARRISPDDFHNFDYILAMDQGHHSILKNMTSPESASELSLFMDYAPDSPGIDVPDPYYGGNDDFSHAFNLIEQGAQGFLNHLKIKI